MGEEKGKETGEEKRRNSLRGCEVYLNCIYICVVLLALVGRAKVQLVFQGLDHGPGFV